MSSEQQMKLDWNVSHTLWDQKYGQDSDTWLVEEDSLFIFFGIFVTKVNGGIPMALEIKKAYPLSYRVHLTWLGTLVNVGRLLLGP